LRELSCHHCLCKWNPKLKTPTKKPYGIYRNEVIPIHGKQRYSHTNSRYDAAARLNTEDVQQTTVFTKGEAAFTQVDSIHRNLPYSSQR
jgi:hypothetical protein